MAIEYFGDGPYESIAQRVARCKYLADWVSSKVIFAKVSNGERVWFSTVYSLKYEGVIYEMITSEEYMMRKLAGTLKSEYNPKDYEKPSRGTYMVGP